MEYLYTGAVHGVTVGRVDIDMLQAALPATKFDSGHTRLGSAVWR
jgi:hypothetical protein